MTNEKRRRRQRTYPLHSLEECIQIPKEIVKAVGNGSIYRQVLARNLNTTPLSSAFVMKLKSSERYGLTTGGSGDEFIELTELGMAIVSPNSSEEQYRSLLQAALFPDLFNRFYDKYEGQKLPPDDFAKNSLVREFGVKPDLTDECLTVLKTNGVYVGILGSIGKDLYVSSSGAHQQPKNVLFGQRRTGSDPESLDTEKKNILNEDLDPKCILICHIGFSPTAEHLKTTLESFGVALLQLELKEDSILIDTHLDTLSRCDAAILIHDESDIQDIHLVNRSDAREGTIYLLGAVTSNYGNRVIFLREQGLEAFKQESYIKAIEFNENSVQEASLNVLQSLYSMKILKVQT
tara:strand:- start:8402 stop:9448 length:1047 start_codon:yes stop_codon:yes gene_type:complete